jgi:hypothetical protein
MMAMKWLQELTAVMLLDELRTETKGAASSTANEVDQRLLSPLS